MAKASYDSVIKWLEDNGGMDKFTSYDDLDEFRKDFKEARDNLPGTSKQVSQFEKLMDDYIKGSVIPDTKPSYNSLRNSIESSKLTEVKKMTLENAQKELTSINSSPYYSSDLKSKVESVVADKISETEVVVDTSSLTSSISDLRSATTISDIERAIEQSLSGKEARKLSKELAGELSMAKAEASERKFDMEQARKLAEEKSEGM
jgi:hypothetical protein